MSTEPAPPETSHAPPDAPQRLPLGALTWRDLAPPVFAVPPVVWILAGGYVLLHLLTQGTYGIFRDELYYLACADHLDWGYVDHPPLSILLLWLQRAVFGDSLLAIRLLPSLAGGLLVWMTAVLARELGGDRFAQGLAALIAATVPQFLGLTGFYSMNAIDLLVWVVTAWWVARIAATGDDRLWLPFGVVAGLGLLNKISVLFLGTGLVVGLVATPMRRHLRSPRLYQGGGIAALLFAPHVVWQIANGWPTLEFIDNAKRYKMVALAPMDFLGAQALQMGPALLPLWLLGLGALFFAPSLRTFRVLGWIFATVLTVLIVQHGKPYYLAAAYPILVAAGAVVLARGTSEGARRRTRPVLVGYLLLAGAVSAPMAIPILPVERFIAYQQALGLAPTAAENSELGPLPQHFADRFGWREMTDAVTNVVDALPPEERASALIVTANYGEAGALRYFGRGRNLPPVASQHNNFFLWGPGVDRGDVVILVGISPEAEGLGEIYESIEVAAGFDSPYAMPYETEHPVVVCRGPKIPLADAWRRGKRFI